MFSGKGLLILLLGIILGAIVAGGMFYLGQTRQNSVPNGQVSIAPEATLTPSSQTGTIEGSLSFPSEGIPENMEVCAESLDGEVIACTDEHISHPKYTYKEGYTLEVPSGNYYVYATLPGFGDGYKAYYNEFVECGLSVGCESHEPIEVNVSAGETVENIDPGDWYAN